MAPKILCITKKNADSEHAQDRLPIIGKKEKKKGGLKLIKCVILIKKFPLQIVTLRQSKRKPIFLDCSVLWIPFKKKMFLKII